MHRRACPSQAHSTAQCESLFACPGMQCQHTAWDAARWPPQTRTSQAACLTAHLRIGQRAARRRQRQRRSATDHGSCHARSSVEFEKVPPVPPLKPGGQDPASRCRQVHAGSAIVAARHNAGETSAKTGKHARAPACLTCAGCALKHTPLRLSHTRTEAMQLHVAASRKPGDTCVGRGGAGGCLACCRPETPKKAGRMRGRPLHGALPCMHGIAFLLLPHCKQPAPTWTDRGTCRPLPGLQQPQTRLTASLRGNLGTHHHRRHHCPQRCKHE